MFLCSKSKSDLTMLTVVFVALRSYDSYGLFLSIVYLFSIKNFNISWNVNSLFSLLTGEAQNFHYINEVQHGHDYFLNASDRHFSSFSVIIFSLVSIFSFHYCFCINNKQVCTSYLAVRYITKTNSNWSLKIFMRMEYRVYYSIFEKNEKFEIEII